MPVCVESQQKTVLKALIKLPHNTLQLRDLDVLCPNPRILELRDMGFYIITMWQQIIDKQGDTHKIGRYIYMNDKDELTKKGEAFKAELH